MERTAMITTNSFGNLKKVRRLTKTATSLQLIPRSKKRKNITNSSPNKKLSDMVLLEHLNYGHDVFIESYIKNHKLSDELQKYLIRGHKLKLIHLYIKYHGFSKSAQETFLEFMEERLLR